MSYNTELQSNNADLQEILDAVNELPNTEDLVSPTATVTETAEGAVITITDKNGKTEAFVPNGNDYILTDADKDEIAEKVSIVKVAEQPSFVNDISECVDTSKMYVLPNGHLCAYKKKEVTTEGSVTPNFTNIFDKSKGAYIKDGYRYSSSAAAFKEQADVCSVVVPITVPETVGSQITLRVRGATKNAAYAAANYSYGGTTNETFGGSLIMTESYTAGANGDLIIQLKTIAASVNVNYFVFNVDAGVDEDGLIITQDEEITYTTTEGGTEIVTEWTDTGIEYNQPPDYSERVTALEGKTARLRADVDALEVKIGQGVIGSAGPYAFSIPAYAPHPQLPGDGSENADFNVDHIPTADAYAYMDALWNRYRTYIVKQCLGKDTSGQYDYFRYVLSKAYWRAWYKENYPKMYAWKNGNTVVYSVSVSPRVGDTMYATSYIGTAYNTVTAVNSTTLGTASTRTVNGLEFTRYPDGDVEPTLVYTPPHALSNGTEGGYIYTSAFAFYKSIAEFTHEYIVDSAGDKYYRYPFEDKKVDKTRPLSVFILANEHGNNGDSLMPSVTVMRMAKDLCENTNNHFLEWLKENAVITMIPVGNPWGYNKDPSTSDSGYFNANGVNINRNYDTPGWIGSDYNYGGLETFGAYAGSENETQYIMNTIQQCKADVGVSYHGIGYVPSKHGSGEYNGNAVFQGCGFDQTRMWKVEEALFSGYNFGFSPDTHSTFDDSANSYNNCGKSPAYIEYAGAVGGLIESIDWEIGTADNYTPVAMEQAYAELLLVLQNWCEEALLKVS